MWSTRLLQPARVSLPLLLLLLTAATSLPAGANAAFGLAARHVRLQAVPGCRPWSVESPQRCEYVRQHCADLGGNFINFLEIHFCELEDRPWASLALQLSWTVLMFLIMLEACDRFFCPSIERISEWLRLSPTVAGATLLAFGNGAADLFMQIKMALSGPPLGQGFELALTEPLGTGMFVTHVVVAAIILVTPQRRVHVSRVNFMKDCCFFLGGVAALLALLLRGRIEHWQISLPALYYVVYICVTLLLDRGTEPLHADPRRHEVPHFRTTSYLDDIFVVRAVAELEQERAGERAAAEALDAASRALEEEMEREEERQAALAWELRGRGDPGGGKANPDEAWSNGRAQGGSKGPGPGPGVVAVQLDVYCLSDPMSTLDPEDPGHRSDLDPEGPAFPLGALSRRSGSDPVDQAPTPALDAADPCPHRGRGLSCDLHPPPQLKGSCGEAAPGTTGPATLAARCICPPELHASCTAGSQSVCSTCSGTAGTTDQEGRYGRAPAQLLDLQYDPRYGLQRPPLGLQYESDHSLYRPLLGTGYLHASLMDLDLERPRSPQQQQCHDEQQQQQQQGRRIEWWRLLRSPIRVMLSLTLPLVSNRKGSGARYDKRYATLLPLVLPLLLAVYCFGFNPLAADWAGSWKLQAAAAGCAGTSLLLLLLYPAHGRLQGWPLGMCTVVAFLGSILLIQFCADEVVAITMACGAIFNVSSPVLTATFLSWASSAGDAISNLALARDGFPTMALTACFSSPLFVLLGGLTCTLVIFLREGGGPILLPSADELLVLYGSCVVCSAVWVITMPLVFRYKLTSTTAAMAIGMYLAFQAVYILYAL